MTTRHIDLLWLFLMFATALSWWLAEASPGAGVTGVVLALAFLKGRTVALDFMGLRGVRRPWPWLVGGWLVVVLAVIAFTFLQAPAA
ncbi:MAG: cytochrome C oxidase subunit IV family protein [Rhodocyclaceae bacterium]|nr:cytochrome C oxidase subunit IV family protein [Rhodocyclaceae bacterium]